MRPIGSRTGFSFSRFRIPQLCNWTGRGIYLDADMLVFTDIARLWQTDMQGTPCALLRANHWQRAGAAI